jgi:tetratricopeptide (TPR) repeat protein
MILMHTARRCLNYFVPAVLCVWICACSPVTETRDRGESNRHITIGQRRARNMEYDKAAEAFEKALEDDPRSPTAHFELGLVCYQNLNNYAAAVYHFEKYLALRPDAPQAETVRSFIIDCKQELARGVSLAAVSQKMQQELERTSRENERLREQVELLSRSLAIATNRPPLFRPTANLTSSEMPDILSSEPTGNARPGASTAQPSSTTTVPARSHIVKRGETPYSISRRYGIKLNSLLGANPGLDPKRMRAGQTLKIPLG